MQLPVPSNSDGVRQHRQRGHGFLSSSWGQQLLLSCGAQGTPFPGSSSQGETQEQVVQIRNTSVRDCFKTRLFQASRTKDVERSTQHHSVDQPCLVAASTSISPCVLAPVDGNHGWKDLKGRGGDRETAAGTLLSSPRSRECGPTPGWPSEDEGMDTSNVDSHRAGSQVPAA